jgi:hypothetical protein
MPKVTLQVRTRDNLLELLAQNQTGDWRVARGRIEQITHVQVVNWDGTQMIEAVFDRNASHYIDPPDEKPDEKRLLVKFLDGRIVNCNIQFKGRGVVRYIEDNPLT